MEGGTAVTRKLKPVEILVPEPLRSAMLSVAVPDEHGQFTTVGTLIGEAREAIRRANEALADNSLVDLAAQDMMKGHRRRGNASVEVGATGAVLLRISYKQTPASSDVTIAPGGAGLPSLVSLRSQATELGLDVSHLGRKKREIMDMIVTAHEGEDPIPARLRDEVSTSTPLHSTKLPPR
jgi:hypothetical protein